MGATTHSAMFAAIEIRTSMLLLQAIRTPANPQAKNKNFITKLLYIQMNVAMTL